MRRRPSAVSPAVACSKQLLASQLLAGLLLAALPLAGCFNNLGQKDDPGEGVDSVEMASTEAALLSIGADGLDPALTANAAAATAAQRAGMYLQPAGCV